MVDDIRMLISTRPFVPFTIYGADRNPLHVPTIDHIAVLPSGARVVVFGDKNEIHILSPELISRVSVDRGQVSQPSA
jgi:hypothetical protein